MKWIARPEYLDFLQRFRGRDLIKVVSGVRRCGKPTLFLLYRQNTTRISGTVLSLTPYNSKTRRKP